MFKKNKKQIENVKEKKVCIVKVGIYKKIVIVLWVVFIVSVSFGVYKNFIVIDQYMIYEKEVIEFCLQDINGIENFVKNFVKFYYIWSNSKEVIDVRMQVISGYLIKELQDLNMDIIRMDILISFVIIDVIVWSIEQFGMDIFFVIYEVDQQIKEGEQIIVVKVIYIVKVYVDVGGNMVIIQNFIFVLVIEKLDYELKILEVDVSVDVDIINDVIVFLEIFFKLYLIVIEKEFVYYVFGNVFEFIGRDYFYFELVNFIFMVDGDNVKVKVVVKFIDNQIKVIQVLQFELVLYKESNWKIIG